MYRTLVTTISAENLFGFFGFTIYYCYNSNDLFIPTGESLGQYLSLSRSLSIHFDTNDQTFNSRTKKKTSKNLMVKQLKIRFYAITCVEAIEQF